VRTLTDGGMDSVAARRMVILAGFLSDRRSGGYGERLEPVRIVTAMSLGYAFVMSILGPMWSTPAEIAGPKGVGFAGGFVNFIGNVGGLVRQFSWGSFSSTSIPSPPPSSSPRHNPGLRAAVHSLVSRRCGQRICRSFSRRSWR